MPGEIQTTVLRRFVKPAFLNYKMLQQLPHARKDMLRRVYVLLMKPISAIMTDRLRFALLIELPLMYTCTETDLSL